MKLRVIFLNKKLIYFLILTLILFILLIILLFSKNYTSTYNKVFDDKLIKADLNGDGKDDILSVKKDGIKYTLEVKTKEENFTIKPDKSSLPIGYYSLYWPMRVTLMDVSRDKIPEIFIQASNKNNPVQHIFIWNDGKFENIFSNSNNILGFIDCKNNKTPKVISGVLQDNKISLSNYIFLNYKFKNYNYDSNTTFMGKDTICSFVKFIQGLPYNETHRPQEIFIPTLDKSSLSVIDKLAGENNTYVFQDGIFTENKCNKDGEVSEVLWTLNFRGISNINKNIVKNYSLNILLTADIKSTENFYFKITSMYFKTS